MRILDVLVEEALCVLRRVRGRFGRVWVNFSGGKDSLVALDPATQVFKPNEMKIIYIEITGNTAGCNVDYVYRVCERYYSEYELVHIRPPFDFLS